MSKSDYLETEVLKSVFQGAALAFAADTIWYIALHTADPGEAGTQSTSEVSGLTGYARKSINRNNTDFTVSGNTVSNAVLETMATVIGSLIQQQ